MAEVKYVIKTEADLAGITKTTAALNQMAAAEAKAAAVAKQHKADIKGVTLEQFNLDSATVGTARAMGKAAEETNKAAGAKRGMIPLMGMLSKGANAAGASVAFLARGMNVLKIALVSSAWGIAIAAVGALVGWFIKLMGKSDEAAGSIGKLTEKITKAAEANVKFAASTREANDALDEQARAEFKRIEDVETAKLEAAQQVERAQLAGRIDTGELTGEAAIRARTGLDERQRVAKEALAERLRQSRSRTMEILGERTQSDVERARSELSAVEAQRNQFMTAPFEQLPAQMQADLLSGKTTRKDIMFQHGMNLMAARENLANVQAGAAPVIERIRQGQMDIGAERTVAGIRSGAAGQVAGIEMTSKMELEETKRQRDAVLEAKREVTEALKGMADAVKSINSRARTSRD